MIKLIRSKKIDYEIATSYHDLTWKQWLDIKGSKDTNRLISILTTIPENDIKYLSQKTVNLLESLLSFINKEIQLEGLESVKELDGIKIVDIKECQYGQKVLFHELMKESPELFEVIPKIIMIYHQPFYDNIDFNSDRMELLEDKVNNLNMFEVYSVGVQYINQLKEVIKDEVETLTVKPTPEQIRAGIDMFNEYGVMNTIKALANGNILNYEAVLKMEYSTVYLHLKMNNTDAIFKENYAKVLSNKRGRI